MIRTTLATRLRRLALSLAATCGLASAGTLHVVLDTSSFGPATGYVDMQLSASAGIPLATAHVTNLSGFDPALYVDSWGVTPSGNGYLFRNDQSNDLYQAAHLGGNLSFDLGFAGDIDPATSYISEFVVSLYDASGAPLGNPDPFTGALATFSWTPATSATDTGTVGVTVNDAGIVSVAAKAAGAAIPEPSDAMLIGAGLGVLWLTRRRRTSGRIVAG